MFDGIEASAEQRVGETEFFRLLGVFDVPGCLALHIEQSTDFHLSFDRPSSRTLSG